MSLLWVPLVFQTCGAFSGLRRDWSGKRAKVFPAKRAGLSGDATRGALLPDPLWDTSGLPPAWSLETRVAETKWPAPSWPPFCERVDSPRGRRAESGFGLCGFASNKEIRSNPPNLLSISPLPAPRPTRPARREARKVRAARSDLCRRLGSTSERVCLWTSECVNVRECVYECVRAVLAVAGERRLRSLDRARRQPSQPTPSPGGNLTLRAGVGRRTEPSRCWAGETPGFYSPGCSPGFAAF